MEFDGIVEREKITIKKQEQINILKIELEKLINQKNELYPDEKINKEKNNLKNRLFAEFRTYFEQQGFVNISDISEEKNSHVGNLKVITASIGNYKVKMSISDKYSIYLDVQHKNDFGNEEYRLEFDMSSECTVPISNINPFGKLDLNKYIDNLKEDIENVKEFINKNIPIKIICKFQDGQRVDIFKELSSFDDIIKEIPEK